VIDDVVTHDEVLRWLPTRIQREWADAERARVLALPPEERGWWTRAEAKADGGNFVELVTLSESASRFIRGRE
jgi:hypothetical protein